MNKKKTDLPTVIRPISLALMVFGLIDSLFLTWEHFQNSVPPCSTEGCSDVLTSSYAVFLGLPTALWGAVFYLTLLLLMIYSISHRGRHQKIKVLLLLTSFGLLISLYLTAVQIFILQALCIYCLASAVTNFGLWITMGVLYFYGRR